MEPKPIKGIAAKLIATLGQPMKAGPKTMPPSVLRHDWKFETFHDPALEKMLEGARQFCADMLNGVPAYWLTYAGPSGTGKTHLTRHIARFFNAHLYGTSYVAEPNIIRCRYGKTWEWKECVKSMREGAYGSIESMSDDWYCGIDDIGTDRDPTKFAADKLLELLNQRRDKWTVITSNLFLDEIGDQLDVRLASRLLRDGSKVVQVDSIDFNRRAKVQPSPT
jgi:DNA replication protein DnaC